MTLKLVVFDVDGTLSDSQALIHASMATSFAGLGLEAPGLSEVLGIVGLSLPQAMARLRPDLPEATIGALVAGYKASYFDQRAGAPAPLYPGAMACLQHLATRDDLLLGIATGKSRRGLEALLTHYGLEQMFVTRQVADDHPSKPHPAMLLATLAETGVTAGQAVMIGDTTFDIEMGRGAGFATIGVSWGYHPVAALRAAGAGCIVDTFEALECAVDDVLEIA